MPDSVGFQSFSLLADDDEISANYISDLADRLERFPSAAAAIARQEIMAESGATLRQSRSPLPDRICGTDFIRAAWHTHEYRYECFATFMARTEQIKACGGYPDFTTGTHNDDALLIKLCLAGDVILSDQSCFRWRMYESSHGWSISIADLAKASKEFLEFLDADPAVLEFARCNPEQWAITKKYLVTLGWTTYYWRWAGFYRQRLSSRAWLQAAFDMPFIPSYYRRVAWTVLSHAKSAVGSPLKKQFPRAYEIYKARKTTRFP